jgi:hypothetical protein
MLFIDNNPLFIVHILFNFFKILNTYLSILLVSITHYFLNISKYACTF